MMEIKLLLSPVFKCLNLVLSAYMVCTVHGTLVLDRISLGREGGGGGGGGGEPWK